MNREMRSRLEEVMAELENMSDEELAAGIRAYAEDLKNYERVGPNLGRMAISPNYEEDHDDDELSELPPGDEGSV